MELYIARHGETISAVNNIILGNGGDSPLTIKGIEEAKTLGESFRHITFDAMYTSPLERALNTIDIAFSGKYTPIVDERLTGIGLGAAEGLTWEKAYIEFPNLESFMSNPISYIPPPQGEKLNDLIERVDSFLNDIIKTNYSKIFILTHGYILRAIYACTIDKLISSIGNAPEYKNCETVHYSYMNKTWKLI